MRKILSLMFVFIALAVFSVAAASAMGVSSIAAIPAAHGQNISGTFTLTNDEAANITAISPSMTVTSLGAQAVSCSPANITVGSVSSCTYAIAVPKFQASGSYSGTLTVSYNNGSAQTKTSSLTVSIPDAPTLNLTWITAPADLYQGQNKTIQYNLSNSGNVALTGNIVTSISLFDISSTTAFSLVPGASYSGSITLRTNSTMAGSSDISINATGTNNALMDSKVLSETIDILYPYCSVNSTSSPIAIKSMKNEEDFDGKTFNPLESFDIEIEIQNTDDDDSHEVVAEAVLMQDNEEIDDTDVDGSIEIGEDDNDKITVNMTIPADISEGDYYLYVKVYNDDRESNCIQKVYPVKVSKSTHDIALNDFIVPVNMSCGASSTIEGNLINLGKTDEDKVKLVYSDSFGSSTTEVIDDFDEGDEAPVSYVLKVPKNATETSGKLTLKIYYKYDEDDEKYGDSDTFMYFFDISGNCQKIVSSQTISTEASTAIVGVESEVRVKISNTGTVQQTYTVSASADWADISSITPPSAVLYAGEEKEVTIKLKAKSGTEIGTHNLVVNVQYGGTSESETVAVTVQKASAPSNLIEQLKFQLKYNPTWVVIDAALILAIIIVIALLIGKKK